MRDGTIVKMQQANARRSALLLGQHEFLQTRQEAFERVVSVSKWYDRVLWIFQPNKMLAIVDAVQISLLNQHKQKMAAEAAKTKIDIVPAGVIGK